MNIGSLLIKDPLLLAPMAGITDHPFRTICKEMGANVVYTEFVSSDGIIRENLKTLNLMKFSDVERPIGIQIFGKDPEVVSKSALIIYNMFKPDIIDINFGCPVPKITKKGAGSAALKDLCLMYEITEAVINAVPEIPITVKMRAGWDNNNIVSTEAGVKLEKIGVAAITLHPRTTKQLFSGKSNWSHITELKQSVNIPIIGNGDVNSVDDYLNMKNITGCDGVMIGRAALGNPWIFKSIIDNKIGVDFQRPLLKEIILICKKHFRLLKKDNNEQISVNLGKKHLSYYLKSFDRASIWRKKIMRAVDTNEIETILDSMEELYS